MQASTLHTNHTPAAVGALLARRSEPAELAARTTDKPRKSKNRMKLLLTLLTATFLTGCALAPGSHINGNNNRWYAGEQQDAEPETDWQEQVSIEAITPSLLGRMAEPKPLPKMESSELTTAMQNYDYTIGIGDVLNITVWDHPELTIPQGSERAPSESGNWVHSDGTIFYPYVGKIKVVGLHVTEVRDKITQALDQYIRDPQVDVTVAAFRSKRAYVTGSVEKAGPIPITNIPLTLLDAVNKAGGLSEFADWEKVILVRRGEERVLSLKRLYQEGDLSQNILLQDGDVVHVNRNDDQKVFVLGEVVKAQTVAIGRSNMTLAEALTNAGGLNELQADASGVFVLRREKEGGAKTARIYQLNARNAAALVLADQFLLQARDIVYVTAAPISRWNRVVRQLLPTIQGINSISQIDSRSFNRGN
jgi:polysaccharide export outer membrane protein